MRYTYLLVNPDGKQVELVNARDVWFDDIINAPANAEFSLPLFNAGVGVYDITLGYSQLFIYRGDGDDRRLRWAGEIQFRRADSNNNQWVYTAVNWLGKLAQRLIGDNVTPISYTSTDAATIIQDAITLAQTQPNGDMGLTFGRMDTSVSRDRTDLQFASLLELIQGLTNDHIQNGVDVEIAPNKTVNVYYPTQGTTRPEIVFATGENILSWSFSEDGTAMANDVTALGAGQGISMLTSHTQSADYLRSSYGLRQAATSYKDVSEQDTLDGHAASDLARRQQTVAVLTITVDGSLTPVLGTYGTGDVVTIQINEGTFQLNQPLRIAGLKVMPGNDGEEVVALTLNTL